MNLDKLYIPKGHYVDLEVFVGPQYWRTDGAPVQYPIMVNYTYMGEINTQLLDEIQGDLLAIRKKQLPSGAPLSKKFLQTLGGKLFQALFTPELEKVYRERLTLAQERSSVLRFNLCMSAVQLMSYPWEYLFDPSQNTFISSINGIAFSRRIPTVQYITPLTVTGPLRLLVAISNPDDLDNFNLAPINVTKEQATIEEALGDCEHIEIKFLLEPNINNLRRALRASTRPHIFHFIGHGQWHNDCPHLIITTDTNKVRRIDIDMLWSLMWGQNTLKVVFLAACQSGEVHTDTNSDWLTSSTRTLMGLAPELLRRGIPAVVAMQHPVRMDTAQRFTYYFYKALANEDHIDAAVNLAREDLRLQAENRRDFGTPVLYTLTSQLFRKPELAASETGPGMAL